MNAASSSERCAGIRRCVDAYLDGEFADHERGELEAHIGECEACRAVVKQQSALFDELGSLMRSIGASSQQTRLFNAIKYQ